MPRDNKSQKEAIVGTKQEMNTFKESSFHYDAGVSDLDSRIPDWNTKDELFRSHINEENWPYQSLIFDPRVFTFIFEKTARLFARKPRAKVVPRSGGDEIGARVINELLAYQWDDNERVSASPMIAKWSLMDQNARKYGASFALCKWHYETRPNKKNKKRDVFYDGPDLRVWNNRDVLVDNAYSSIKNWIQLRDYVTIQDLERVNDIAKGKPVYKNLDLLKQQVRLDERSGGDTRSSNWQSRNKSITGVEDRLGMDEVFKTVEIVTEYRKDRWITFAPKHGVVIRDIENPYDHGQIPVVMLKYYPIDDDIYGLSEIEPVERLQKAINSLVCQYVDAINMGLYPIVKVRSQGVQMHTLEFGPGKKWIMDSPDDVMPYEQGTAGIAEFTSTYRFLVSALQEAVGETSSGISNLVPGSPEKTATEIQESSLQRNARDNYNQIFLSEALKKQMMFWMTMNAQFLFNEEDGRAKIIRIADKEAINFFERIGLGARTISDESIQAYADAIGYGADIDPTELEEALFPVNVEGDTLPKFARDTQGDTGFLLLEREDLSGNYDYIPDIESMSLPSDQQLAQARQSLFTTTIAPPVQQSLAQKGWSVNTKLLLEDTYELLGIKNPEKYFEKLQLGGQGELNQGRATATGQSEVSQGANVPSGLGAGNEAPFGGEIQ